MVPLRAIDLGLTDAGNPGNWAAFVRYHLESYMPPEHEQIVSALAAVMYYVRRAHYSHDAERARGNLHKVHKVVLDELNAVDQKRVGLRVLHAAKRVVELAVTAEQWMDPWSVHKAIEDACAEGLRKSKLGRMTEKTWSEQIAGRASLMAKRTWPELQKW